MQCSSCGKQVPDNSIFCLHCGMRISSNAVRPSTNQAVLTVVLCPECSHNNPVHVRFCQKCGTSLIATCRRCGSQNSLATEFCGNCGVKLSEATFGLPKDETGKWQEAFSSLGWFEELGPRTRKLLPQLQPPLDTTKEQILFVTYNNAYNHIHHVLIDGIGLRSSYIGTIGTNWRIIFVDTDAMKFYVFPYEELVTVEKPASGGVMKDVTYTLHTKSRHRINITVRLDAPGLVGVIAGFSNPITAGHVISHKRRAEEVIEFLNLYFTRIVP